jgi:Tfp pilus assembly protein PilN
MPLARLLYLLLALSVFAVAVLQVGKARYEQTQEAQQLADLQGLRTAPSPRSLTNARSDPTELAQAQLVRQTSQRLSTPWADLLAALESAPSNVALLVVEPSAAKRSVSLTAEAAQPTDMLAYLKALQGDARFADVVLVSHQVQQQAPGNPVRFQLRARWGEAP